MITLPYQAATALMLTLALSACGAAPVKHAVAAPKADRVIAALTVAPAMEGGELAEEAALERPFTLTEAGEVLADLRMGARGGDWEVPGREAATVRLSLDGLYNQDVVLYAGERAHVYQVALGSLPAGPHVLSFERLASHSAAAVGQVQLFGGAIGVVPPGAPGHDVLARSPILIGRAGSHRTDTPLLMMVDEQPREAGGSVLRYTAVFSNEDGGTSTPALMARWGRTTDIDWAYAVELDATGTPTRETYQGRFHLTKTFKGRYEDRHPILRVSTDNNCYDDGGNGALRFRLPPLFRLDPVQTAREEVLDRHPWTYAIMAKELYREHKAQKADAALDTPAPAAPLIGDPRRFLYVEFRQTYRGRGLGVAVTLKGQPGVFVSHRGDGGLTAARTGWCRVAVELPRSARLDDLASIDLVGPGRGQAIVHGVRRVLALDEAYQPVILPITWAGEALIDDDADRVRVFEAVPGPSEPGQGAPL